jgi:ubiquinone/menaquinone biosynthesis C-methylase UbiE
VSFYERRILPWLIDLAMRNKDLTRYREIVVPAARGTALEIGVGSGRNLPFYGREVKRLIAVDPSPELLRMAKKRASGAAFPIQFVERSGEELPFDDASIDTAVLTFTLCSIPDPVKALREVRRVLKPSGELLFAEHGLAPEESVRRWQRRLNPLWQPLAGGCNLDRKIDDLIRFGGFRLTAIETGYAKGPRPMAYIYQGRARPT